MICPKQTTSLSKKIGVLLILIFILIIISGTLNADNDLIHLSDIQTLAGNLYENENYFLAYIYNIAAYNLAEKESEKFTYAINALNSCILTDHFKEGLILIRDFSSKFPNHSDYFRYLYAYSLIRSKIYMDGEIYLRNLSNSKIDSHKILCLSAYAALNSNQIEKCKTKLEKIGTGFKYHTNINKLANQLNVGPKYKKKSPMLSLVFSSIIPGSGQAYSGFYYDAMQDFIFNSILGYSCYASWKLELNYKRKNRNYIIPILSSAVFAIFYTTNLFNSVNAAQKANLFNKNQFYKAIINKFDVIISDKQYFLNYKF